MSDKKADKETKTEKVKLSIRMNDFLRINRKPIFVVLIVVIATVVGLGVFTSIQKSLASNAAAMYEALNTKYTEWQSETVEDAKLTKGNGVLTDIENLLKKYKSSYSAQKALLLKAELLSARKDFKGAEEAYLLLAKNYSKSFLAPTALINAAAMAEEGGNKDNALKLLQQAETEFKPDTIGINRALFNIGRIFEEMKQFENASGAYSKLIVKGMDDDWTKLAHDRIIFLKANGLLK